MQDALLDVDAVLSVLLLELPIVAIKDRENLINDPEACIQFGFKGWW